MKYFNIKQIVIVALALTNIIFISGCQDNEDPYGNLDLSLLCISQAREVWDGTECNVSRTLEKGSMEDISFDLNIHLYQKKAASQFATVDLVVVQDSLAKLKERIDEGGIYEKYKDAIVMKSDYYELSSDKVTLNAGETESGNVKVTIFTNKLLADPEAGDNENAFFALPLKLDNSTVYKINAKVSSLMLMVYLPQLDATAPDPREPKQEIDGMKLVWNDEFNKTGEPDWDKWRAEEGFRRNEELQWYQGRNAECMDGTLIITGKVERVKNPNYDANSSDWKKNREYAEYTSTSLVAKDYIFRQGRMLVRAKIPTATGAWPAIWTTGKEVKKDTGEENTWCWEWPLGGEIDILEYYLVGGKSSIHANACWGSNTRWQGSWNSYNRPLEEFENIDANWADKYHIWRMDWDDDYIRLYLDDELLNEIDLSKTGNGSGGSSINDWWRGSWRNPFKDKGNDGYEFGQQIFLNLALGSNGGKPDISKFPLKYYVDYVRVYQYEK